MTIAVLVALSVLASAPQKQADPDETICKTTEVTGTRFPARVCKTRRAWDDIRAEARSFTEKASSGFCTSGCGQVLQKHGP